MEVILAAVVAVLSIWVFILSFFLFKTRSHYNKLVQGTGKEHLDQMLEDFIKKDQKVVEDVKEAKKLVEELRQNQKLFYQKIGFLRFNPFERVSGDQSFIISLLDGENTGIIFNFLYTRDGIRVYAKKIDKGRSTEYELSAEEKEVILNAK